MEETEALVAGVEACGNGKWADIKKLGFRAIDGRSAVDLKDKWRNLLRVALMPSTALKCAAAALDQCLPLAMQDRVHLALYFLGLPRGVGGGGGTQPCSLLKRKQMRATCCVSRSCLPPRSSAPPLFPTSRSACNFLCKLGCFSGGGWLL